MTEAARRGKRARGRQRCVLGIDVGGTSIRAGLFIPRSGSVQHVRAIRTDAQNGGRHALSRAAAVAREVVEAGDRSGLSVEKVGIGVPELVSPSGEIESRAVAPWKSAGVRKTFGPYGEVVIASDVRAAALAEARLGVARGNATFLYVGVGTGISSTLFIDGEPYVGSHGHAIAFASGPTCAAGTHDGGTVYAPLESRASGPALVRRAKALGYHAEDAAEVCRAARVRTWHRAPCRRRRGDRARGSRRNTGQCAGPVAGRAGRRPGKRAGPVLEQLSRRAAALHLGQACTASARPARASRGAWRNDRCGLECSRGVDESVTSIGSCASVGQRYRNQRAREQHEHSHNDEDRCPE